MKHLNEFIKESILNSTHSGKNSLTQSFLDNNAFIFKNNCTTDQNKIVPVHDNDFEVHLDVLKEKIPEYVVFGKLENCIMYIRLSQWNELMDEQKPDELKELHIICDDTILKQFNTIIWDVLVLDGEQIDNLTKIENMTIKFSRNGWQRLRFNRLNKIDKSEIQNISLKNQRTVEIFNCNFFTSTIEYAILNSTPSNGAKGFSIGFKRVYPNLAKGTHIVRVRSQKLNCAYKRKGSLFVVKPEIPE